MPKMPLARYFLFVGGALLALLFVANAALPKLSVSDQTQAAAADFPVIRIRSERKWPERIVFDTSVPATVPTRVAKVETAKTAPAPTTIAEFSAKAHVREAFAQFPPSSESDELQPVVPGARFHPSEPRKLEPRVQPKRKVVKRRVAPPIMLVAQQPQFGFSANRFW